MGGFLQNILGGSGGGAAQRAVQEAVKTRYFPEVWFMLEAWLSMAKTRLVLDVGSGNGLISEALAKSGWVVTSIDPELTRLIATQKRFSDASLEGRFEQGAPEALPFNAGSFDSVVSVNMLEFCTDPVSAIKEMHRVLRPGGRGVIATFNRASPWGMQTVARLVRGDNDGCPFRSLGRAEFKKAVKSSGFHVDSIKERARYLPFSSRLGRIKMPVPGCFVAMVAKDVPGEFVESGTKTRVSRVPVNLASKKKK